MLCLHACQGGIHYNIIFLGAKKQFDKQRKKQFDKQRRREFQNSQGPLVIVLHSLANFLFLFCVSEVCSFVASLLLGPKPPSELRGLASCKPSFSRMNLLKKSRLECSVSQRPTLNKTPSGTLCFRTAFRKVIA